MELSPVLCNDLGAWDEGGGEEGPRGRGCVCVHIVGSLWCTAETNTILPSNRIQIKKNDSETDNFFQNRRSGYIVGTYWMKTKKNTISLRSPGLQKW